MAYVTGTANSELDLLNALKNACVANGWTYTGIVLHKGDIHVALSQSAVVGAGSAFVATLGKGMTGGGAGLTDPMPYGMAMRFLTQFQSAFPVSYDIHVFDTEVYMFSWSADNAYTWLAFGQSSPFSLTPGAGNNLWISSSACDYVAVSLGGTTPINLSPDGSTHTENAGGASVNRGTSALFASVVATGTNRSPNNSLYTGTTGLLQGGQGGLSVANEANAMRTLTPLFGRQPNAWNQESALLPVQVYTPVASTKRQLDIQLRHSRYFRLSTRDPRAIFTVSGQQWICYPFRRLDRSAPNGGSGIDHSGTIGLAIKYTGA